LLWSINKSLTDLICQLEYRNKVANAEAKAHCDLEHSTVIAAEEGNLGGKKRLSHPNCESVVAMNLARQLEVGFGGRST